MNNKVFMLSHSHLSTGKIALLNFSGVGYAVYLLYMNDLGCCVNTKSKHIW